MKKVINGKVYDSDKAKKLGYWSNKVSRRDFDFCEETLYKTKAGAYFVHGSGGGNSKYGEWHGNSGGPGEAIRPYTEADAKEWCEEKLDTDEYINIWGEPEEA